MHHVHWTLDLIACLSPAGFCIENVDAMPVHLRPCFGVFTTSLDLSYWVPQQRHRSFVSSFGLRLWVQPTRDTPIPASAVLPQFAPGSLIVNRYEHSRPLTEPSLTTAGKPVTMHSPANPVTGEPAPPGSLLRFKMPATVAMVLQGFPAGCDLSSAPTDAVRYQAIGGAVMLSPHLSLVLLALASIGSHILYRICFSMLLHYLLLLAPRSCGSTV
jgi:hypothetical protein